MTFVFLNPSVGVKCQKKFILRAKEALSVIIDHYLNDAGNDRRTNSFESYF